MPYIVRPDGSIVADTADEAIELARKLARGAPASQSGLIFADVAHSHHHHSMQQLASIPVAPQRRVSARQVRPAARQADTGGEDFGWWDAFFVALTVGMRLLLQS